MICIKLNIKVSTNHKIIALVTEGLTKIICAKKKNPNHLNLQFQPITLPLSIYMIQDEMKTFCRGAHKHHSCKVLVE